MSRVFLVLLIIFLSAENAFAWGTIMCQSESSGVTCFSNSGYPSGYDSQKALYDACANHYSGDSNRCASHILERAFENMCVSVYANSQNQPLFAISNSAKDAIGDSLTLCINSEHAGFNCKRVALECDGTGTPLAPSANTVPQPSQGAFTRTAETAVPNPPTTDDHSFDYISDRRFWQAIFIGNILDAIRTGIGIGLGVLIILGLFFKRAAFANFIIHGNLPYKLPIYGEDIQCLFKRTQRINWYGRTIFGIVVNLAMTHQQLLDVRKYWLGRVIAFDSLRRQRQNQLAKMHLQLAAGAKSDVHDKRKFWSRRWANIRAFFKMVFWVFTAFFSFVLGFFFIRVTLAKLIRGTIVESKDLVLILQAKEAIEESTNYLKEYLLTANTFDGRDEVYEPE